MNFSKPGQPQDYGRRTPPPPTSSPLPSYAPKPPIHSFTDTPRRPLSASSANIPGRSAYPSGSDPSNPTILQRKSSYEAGDDAFMRERASEVENRKTLQNFSMEASQRSTGRSPVTQSIPYRQRLTTERAHILQEPQSAVISTANGSEPDSRHTSGGSLAPSSRHPSGNSIGNDWKTEQIQPLQYHHQIFESENQRPSERDGRTAPPVRPSSEGPLRISPRASSQHLAPNTHLGANLARPASAFSLGSELSLSGRSLSPGQDARSSSPYGRRSTPSRLSPDSRPVSYIDLLNVPYPQPPPAPSSLDNSHLRSAIGQNASLLSTKKTLEMYRANVKKTNDPTIQYEFAVFMINAAQEMGPDGLVDDSRQPSPRPNQDLDGPAGDKTTTVVSQKEMFREARNILQKLSDRSYPFAQYYLADGYASGLFNKGVEDNDRAFPLFVAASKHGHAEAGYRAALCYEFGWGSRKDVNKAVQFYRQSASKNHPGAMSRLGRACLVGDLGLGNRYREGLKWLKRAAESADFQYNAAPYELGLLHETGYGDDIFRDEAYAAQLFTQSADLGHVEANYRLGDSYEHGKLSCPRDPALSVHFYTRAAEREHPLAMMALCAWYMVGAEPVLDKDENEAYEWARKAAEAGLPKAEYAVGYFTEMGIGCRRDPLESNRWYVRAAESGDERAKHRLAAIAAAASGGSNPSGDKQSSDSSKKTGDTSKSRKWGLF